MYFKLMLNQAQFSISLLVFPAQSNFVFVSIFRYSNSLIKHPIQLSMIFDISCCINSRTPIGGMNYIVGYYY